MTIDEAVKHAREVAEEQKRKYDAHKKVNFTVDFEHEKCLQRAEEYEQLAEWLEDYKRINKFNDGYYKAGYTKAIYDFAETLIPRLTDAIYPKDVEGMRNLINEVAEQLKKGSADNE